MKIPTSNDGLNPRKRATLLAIANLVDANDWPPSFQEVGDASGIGEKRVHYWIALLARDGYITRSLNGRRDIEVTPQGRRIVRQLRRKQAR